MNVLHVEKETKLTRTTFIRRKINPKPSVGLGFPLFSQKHIT